MNDRKDFKILEILAQNCRVTHAIIASALSVSKDTVAYRIAQLERNNSIDQYVLFIDGRRLGLTRHHFLMRFDSSLKEREAAYSKIKRLPFVMWINTFIGRYDIQIIVDALDGFHLNQIRNELMEAAGHHVKEYIVLTHLADLEFTQLNPILDLRTKFERRADASFSNVLCKRNFPVHLEFKRYPVSRLEGEILNVLADDPRASISEIARLVHADRQTIRKHISKLIREGVILSFGAIPNLTKLGFVTYYLLVRLTQNTPLKVLQKPFQNLRNIFYAGQMMGDYDLILYLNARSPQELNESIELFRRDLSQYIEHYDLLVQEKVHHWRQFTPGIYNLIRNKE